MSDYQKVRAVEVDHDAGQIVIDVAENHPDALWLSDLPELVATELPDLWARFGVQLLRDAFGGALGERYAATPSERWCSTDCVSSIEVLGMKPVEDLPEGVELRLKISLAPRELLHGFAPGNAWSAAAHPDLEPFA